MRTLLFDIDGTLLTTHGAGSGAIAEVFRRDFALTSPDLDIDFSGKTDGFLIAELLRRNGLSPLAATITQFREAYCEMFPGIMNARGGLLLPGVLELLQRCAASPGIALFAMTGNCEPTAREKLRHFNLLGYFRSIFGADHDQHRNDLARRTHGLLRHLHGWVDNDPIVVIGDTPDDVHCGREIGAITVAVATGRYDLAALETAGPDVLCRDLTDAAAVAAIIGAE